MQMDAQTFMDMLLYVCTVDSCDAFINAYLHGCLKLI